MNAILKSITKGMRKDKTQTQTDDENDNFSKTLTNDEVQAIETRVREAFCKRDDKGVCIDSPAVISARELSESGLIGWINSYKALLKYVSKDYRHIFEPKTTGSRSGTRYYVPTQNVVKFLVMFEENKL